MQIHFGFTQFGEIVRTRFMDEREIMMDTLISILSACEQKSGFSLHHKFLKSDNSALHFELGFVSTHHFLLIFVYWLQIV